MCEHPGALERHGFVFAMPRYLHSDRLARRMKHSSKRQLDEVFIINQCVPRMDCKESNI